MKTNEWGSKVEEYYDEIAERIRMLGSLPITNLMDILKLSAIKEIEGKSINAELGLNELLEELKIINSMTKQLGDIALNTGDLSTLNILMPFKYYLDKTIWLNTLSKK